MNPTLPLVDAPLVRIAEDQPQYTPVTAARVSHPDYPTPRGPNTLLLAFRPSDAERAQLAAGADVYVALLTFGGPMQPILIYAGAEAAARAYGLQPLAPAGRSETP